MTDVRAALDAILDDGRVYPAERPDLVPALLVAHEHELVRRHGRPPVPAEEQPYRLTRRGHRWLVRPWDLRPLHAPHQLARIRRDTIIGAVLAGDFDAEELARELEVSVRRVRQIARQARAAMGGES